MRGVALCSTQVVSVYASPISESRKVAELAGYTQENGVLRRSARGCQESLAIRAARKK